MSLNLCTLFHNNSKNELICDACSFYCRIENNCYGKCGVRKRVDDKLFLTTYSKVSAINIDPIEKKPLFHFLPNSKSLSIGTVGCNFSCSFCQNYQISQYPNENSHKIFGDDLTPQQIIDLAIFHKAESISYTYNEPAIFFEFAYDIAKLAKKNGIKNIFVTSGYESIKALKTIAPYLDGMNIDLKSFNDEFYKKYCGARLKPVLNTINYAKKLGIFFEITTLLIPNLNDSQKELEELATYIKKLDQNIPWHISAFFPQYKMQNIKPTSQTTLLKAYEIGKKIGLNYVYTGNFNNTQTSSTYCPKCNFQVIKRGGRIGDIVRNFLKKDLCPNCEFKIYGVFY